MCLYELLLPSKPKLNRSGYPWNSATNGDIDVFVKGALLQNVTILNADQLLYSYEFGACLALTHILLVKTHLLLCPTTTLAINALRNPSFSRGLNTNSLHAEGETFAKTGPDDSRK